MKTPTPWRSGAGDDYLNRFKRFFHVDRRLRDGGCPSVSVLARECGVSTKTIYRDLESLRTEFGAPLEYVARMRGWRYQGTTFALPAAVLGKRDLFALMVAEKAVAQYEGTPLAQELRMSFDKILSALPPDELRAHRIASAAIHFGGLPAPRIDPDVWSALACAIRDRQVLELDYRPAGDCSVQPREVEPYALVVRDRDWFLVGRSVLHDQIPMYYLPRIAGIRPLGRLFEVPDGFSVEEYLAQGFNAVQSGRGIYSIALRFPPDHAHLASERAWSPSQQIARHRDGSVTVRFHSSALFEIERQVLRFAGAVEVVAPRELRESVARAASIVARMHRTKTPDSGRITRSGRSTDRRAKGRNPDGRARNAGERRSGRAP
ncbi:MAG: WYL domain-containing protein [Planctomycetes bacterium]|nr:WYL domain-containing protein [Planctomycetota bacterium]